MFALQFVLPFTYFLTDLMKQLFLFRHAKSSWDNGNLSDFERPLNHRGISDIPNMAKVLLKKNEVIDHLFCSSAARTVATLLGYSQSLHFKAGQQSLHKNLYLASVRELLHYVNTADDNWQSVALIGHNPGLTDFCEYLTNASVFNIPTCGIAKITFQLSDWSLVSAGLGKLEYLEFPKNQED